VSEGLRLALFFGLIAFLVARNLPGALVFLRPAFIRCRVEGGPEAAPRVARGMAMREMGNDLEEQGYAPVGVLSERRPLARARRELVVASPEGEGFAVVAPVGNEAWLHFVTTFEDGSTVITADYRWPSVERKDYLAGGLPGGSVLEVLNTHRRRVRRFVEEGRRPDERRTLEARREACNAYHARGPGRREVRRREVKAMMFTTVAVLWAGMVLVSTLTR
jgi:hypothetical protein